MRRAFLLLVSLAGCTSEGSARSDVKRAPLKFPVETKAIESRTVDFEVNAVGSVAAFERVRVTARVAGVVERVRFNEGEQVKEGQVLAEIEPARFSTAVSSAKATLERAQASEAEAAAGLARREQALASSPGLITGEELETWRTRGRVAAAEAAQAKAALDQAQLNLRDAYLRAPIEGTIQTKTVETGQYLQPGDVVATLVRREPLLLRFQVPERDAQRLATGMTARFRVQSDATQHRAKLTHVSDAAEMSTRMVSVTGEVVTSTASGSLRPGAFANVKVTVGAREDAVLIPQAAVRPSERGFLAFVIVDGKAEERVVELGMRTGDGMVEAKSGVAAGETLVVRGVEPLKDGAAVVISEPK